MSLNINQVGIIGTGLIGAGWAAFYASKGFTVSLYDANPSACQLGLDKALEYLSFLKNQSILGPAEYEKAADGLKIAKNLPDAVHDVQLIQESGPENYQIKKKIFHEMDEHTNADVIILSSSSGLLITELQKVMESPQRSLIAHPFNPPHLIPLVELVPGEKTDRQMLSDVKEFFESLGKIPVILKKEIPGHIANRLQAAVWREAINMVLADVASVEDIDRALYAGPGLRWALMGQHLIFHLGGGEGGIEYFVDHIGVGFEALWKSMDDWTAIPPDAKKMLSNGVEMEMGDRKNSELAQWRDEKIVKILKDIYG